MAVDLSKFTISELEERFLTRDADPDESLYQALAHDPRAGVRRIGRRLKEEAERLHREERRLERLLAPERNLWESGVLNAAGVDEAGIGPLAGPVVAAAVVFARGAKIAGINDSKRLDSPTRERLARAIRDKARGIGIGLASVQEIDRLNIYHAAILAMQRAVEALPVRAEHLLIDARSIPRLSIPQTSIVGGDGLSFSIAAASIIAKTHRDSLMDDLDERFPRYGFKRHKGYCTREHRRAIRRHGPCPIHRRSYRILEELQGEYSPAFYEWRDRLAGVKVPSELDDVQRSLEEAGAAFTSDEWRKLRILLRRRRNRIGPVGCQGQRQKGQMVLPLEPGGPGSKSS